ncbi:MAG: metallophosphoesterase [Clostridia bacterium]|nr:metallophosphoesterase [Clostridia bacterium]
MKVFAISDLHLSANVDKPMDIFGGAWDNYWEIIQNNWRKHVGEEDVVLISGDISWAMYLEEAIPDLKAIGALPGYKVIIKGNHDYWWSSVTKVKEILGDKTYVIQNDALRIGNYVFFGTRGWNCPDKAWSEQDEKIYQREGQRLTLSLGVANKIKQEGDVLVGMLHFPPFNVRREDSVFTKILEEAEIRTVVYGHLHGKNCRVSPKVVKNGVSYYLTSCDQVNNMLVRLF